MYASCHGNCTTFQYFVWSAEQGLTAEQKASDAFVRYLQCMLGPTKQWLCLHSVLKLYGVLSSYVCKQSTCQGSETADFLSRHFQFSFREIWDFNLKRQADLSGGCHETITKWGLLWKSISQDMEETSGLEGISGWGGGQGVQAAIGNKLYDHSLVWNPCPPNSWIQIDWGALVCETVL